MAKGAVGGVEVSADGGTTWQRALGREAWTLLVEQRSDPKCDPAQPRGGRRRERRVTLRRHRRECRYSCADLPVFSVGSVPIAGADRRQPSPNEVEVGTRFRSDTSGYVTAIRFYKDVAKYGIHAGHLWTDSGVLLSTVIFSGESASGWQQATFGTPVAINANTTYVVSVSHQRRVLFRRQRLLCLGRVAQRAVVRAARHGIRRQWRLPLPGRQISGRVVCKSELWVDVVFVASVPLSAPASVDPDRHDGRGLRQRHG